MKVTIIEYLGTFNDGIVVSVGLRLDEYFEGIFYYRKEDMMLVMNSDYEEKLGKIEDNVNYIMIIEEIINKCAPYDEKFQTLEPIFLEN